METVRKNITLPIDAYERIIEYAKKNGISFSEFLREAAMNAISKEEEAGLLNYIVSNCDYVDPAEQEELEALSINFDELDGKEITLNELLQS